jgi:hypothetical protein
MKEAFAKVRPACDFQGVLSEEASVGVVNGRMEAYNKFLTVSQPCDLPDFSVPATDFDFALRKVENPKINLTDANVIMKGGGTTRVRRLPERVALKKPNIETHEIKDLDDLLGAIDDVYPFTEGDPARPWSEGARFDDSTVTATNSIVLCQATLASASGFEGVTVSRLALSYIRQRRADLKAWGVSERGILLEFTDGAWALASRMTTEMPDAAVGLVQGINDWGGLATVEPAYRNAILLAADWADGTDDTASIYTDRIQAGRLSSEHDEPAETELGDPDVPAVFAAKALVAVMSVADQIAFDRFPSPVPFKTKRGSSGLLAGRTS